MNREDIIRMAREAGLDPDLWNYTDAFERFAALVASAERERLTDAAMKAAEKAVDVAIALEREACAELVWPKLKVWSEEEQTAMGLAFNKAQEKHGWYETLMAVGASVLKMKAEAIRARGQA